MSRGEGHRRVGMELVVIVAGVLIALGAQAVAQDWSDRRREQAFLADLLEEFRLNEAQLLKDLDETNHAMSSAELWREVDPASAALSTDSSAALYAASLNPARFDPFSGSLRSVIDGGDLGLIRNRHLRAALAGWRDRTQEQVMTSFSVDVIRATLGQFLIAEGQAAPRAALEVDRLMLEVIGTQQNALLEPLRDIIAMLEEEVGPEGS
jgi:hypothetical protein